MVVAFASVLVLHQITLLLKTEEEENFFFFEKEVAVIRQRMKSFLKILLAAVADIAVIEYLQYFNVFLAMFKNSPQPSLLTNIWKIHPNASRYFPEKGISAKLQ